jgi:hypothetical protein
MLVNVITTILTISIQTILAIFDNINHNNLYNFNENNFDNIICNNLDNINHNNLYNNNQNNFDNIICNNLDNIDRNKLGNVNVRDVCMFRRSYVVTCK